jgi:hypothetical protein
MYQRSRQALIFLVVTFLPIQVTCGVIGALLNIGWSSGGKPPLHTQTSAHQAYDTISEEYALSGAHMCVYAFQRDAVQLVGMTWVLTTAWEIFSLCLAVWIVVKHFRELQRPSTRWNVGDSFTVLVKTHVFYFARFAHNFSAII